VVSLDEARERADAWRRFEADPDLQARRLVADAWCAAFVQRKTPGAGPGITHDTVRRIAENLDSVVPVVVDQVGESSSSRRSRGTSPCMPFSWMSTGRRRLPANLAGLSRFIKACEWDLGLAVLRCPRRCGVSPVAALSTPPLRCSPAVSPSTAPWAATACTTAAR
jgi:hypothetical protein